jgi:hypothetical protein
MPAKRKRLISGLLAFYCTPTQSRPVRIMDKCGSAFSHQGLDYAHALAAHDPFPGKSKLKCIDAVDAMFDSLSDDCPACE